MKPIGFILLCGGFLAAAYCSVCRLEDPDNKWLTIPWVWYFSALSVGVIGVILLRVAAIQDRQDSHKTEAEFSTLQQSLGLLIENIKMLRAHQHKWPPHQIVKFIDDQCTEPLADFVDSRSALTKRFGLSVFAEVMTEFASGERYINRTWSAAADGYIDEIVASLSRAEEHLQAARDLINAAEKEIPAQS